MIQQLLCCAILSFVFCSSVFAQEVKEDKPPQKEAAVEKPKGKPEKAAQETKEPAAPEEPKTEAITVPEPLPISLDLFRPNSLIGWTHGEEPVSGWKITNGLLVSEQETTPLLSGHVLNQFELNFNWRCDDQAALVIRMPGVNTDNDLQINLKEGERCGLTLDGGDFRSGGKTIEPSEQLHKALLKREGEKLSLQIDGKQIYNIDFDSTRRVGLQIESRRGIVQLGQMQLKEPLGDSIFNGKDLSGWWTPGKLESWGVDKGELIWIARGGSYIRSDKQYANYTLSFEYTINPGGNSGLGIRTAPDGWPSGDGMELQIYDREGLDKHSTMAIYGNLPPLARADKSGKYNQVVIKAHGRQISAWVNGQLVQQANTFWEPELRHRNLQGWIGFQDHGAKIRVRNIRVREEIAGTGLTAWYQKREEDASRTILARLMNTERLAQNDGVLSHSKKISISEKQQTVAEFEGPGALVKIKTTKPSGKLQLLFDGEQKPRLTLDTKNLGKDLPHVPGKFNGTVTFVGFEQSLKIVAEDAAGTELLIDSVQFSKGDTFSPQVVSFTDKNSALPRGLHSALEYRSFQMGKGTVRQHDPFDRLSGNNLTLQPGDSINAVNCSGRGVIQWLQLKASSKLLQNNDLWIEITVDGESLPAVAAPVRFYFAGLHAGKNYENYIGTNRGGIYNRFAIPFGNGVRVNLSNRSDKEIKGVSLTASVETVAADQRSPRKQFDQALRLRGVFQSASTEKNILNQSGTGRWVGLVLENQNWESPVTLQIDGKPQSELGSLTQADLIGSNEKEFRKNLSGRYQGLTWRHFLLSPIQFNQSLSLTSKSKNQFGGRLALFYVK